MGYRVKEEGRTLVFSLGYSHPINFTLPDGVDCKVEKQVNITLTSIDKQLLGQVAANMYRLRKPDAYKGKGVRYTRPKRRLRQKEGKAKK